MKSVPTVDSPQNIEEIYDWIEQLPKNQRGTAAITLLKVFKFFENNKTYKIIKRQPTIENEIESQKLFKIERSN